MTIRARFHIRRGGFLLDLDLTFPARGITALFGPSGCGKTTLLRAMAGLVRDPGGYCSVGEQVWQDGSRFVPVHRRPLGYVFQEASLFQHLSVQGNLDYGWRRTSPGQRRVSLDDAVELLGIGPLLNRRTHGLSGGERQRVAIARALCTRPSLLLADEPTGNLDEATSEAISARLFDLVSAHGTSLIMVTHDPELARAADRVLHLHDGRLVTETSA